MKTKELIKLLQEEDPSGEAHVRMPGGVPVHVELKEGYYDGPYSYIDEDGNFVETDNGEKVDVYCTDLEEFVWENKGDLSKIKVDFDCFKDRKESVLAEAKKYADRYKSFQETQEASLYMEISRNIANGYQIIQAHSKQNPEHSGFWYIKDLDKFQYEDKHGVRVNNENQKTLCMGAERFIEKSGFFQHTVYGDLKVWHLCLRRND